jgi:cyclopropane-fatty-acyl-phospholipid synthase
MLSEVSTTDLVPFFKIFILNRKYTSTGTVTSSISTSASALLRKTNTLANARLHIAAHYDISNVMFAGFLSPDMTYSCAIFRSLSDPLHANESLEEAQDRKLTRFIENTHIKKGDCVLEIGTGWGSFAIKAVQETGCKVISLTLSQEQQVLAEERIREAGLEDKIEVRLCDYRNMNVPEEGPFDKIVSIEMLEAVGKEFWDTYFACIDKLLKKDGGIAAFQCITIPEAVRRISPRPSTEMLMSIRDMKDIRGVTTSFVVISSLEDIYQPFRTWYLRYRLDQRELLLSITSRILVRITLKLCDFGGRNSSLILMTRLSQL